MFRYYDISSISTSGYARTISAFRIDNFDYDNATDSTNRRLRVIVYDYKEDVTLMSRRYYKQDIRIIVLCDKMPEHMRIVT